MDISLQNLKLHLAQLTRHRDPFLNTGGYLYAREYIRQELSQYGKVDVQTFISSFGQQANLILRLDGTQPDSPSVIIGAHYDTVPESPGADDNASGVSVLLELARLLSQASIQHPIHLVAFDLEEYGLLGSRTYIEQLKSQRQKIKLMLSLEMLGYVNGTPGSQTYPPGLQYFYPSTGNFVALVGNLKTVLAMRVLAKHLRYEGAPCEWLPVPFNGSLLPMTRRSDHAPFWDYGAPAIMVTDTADLRNPNYHKSSDVLETLNLKFLQSVANGLLRGILKIAGQMF